MPPSRFETECPPLASDADFFALLTDSYARLLGTPLVPADSGPHWLYREAPFVLLAHNGEADPRFIYANLAAQECFGYSWNEFIVFGWGSRLTFPAKAKRRRWLEVFSQT